LAEIYTQRHLYPEAVSELKKALDISSGNLEVLAELGYVLGISGKSDQAKQTLLQLKSDNNVSPYRLAIVFMGLGERENALESLTEAVKRRSPGVVHLKITPFFTELRSDQRFKALLLYMGLGIQE
jgi:tetratricopeptide (TPR) repeat protein